MSSGEWEVTLLFLEIRGYTGFSESRGADEIFFTLNRYSETVWQFVQKRAGSVVQFNGAGMLAVFGAPRELAPQGAGHRRGWTRDRGIGRRNDCRRATRCVDPRPT